MNVKTCETQLIKNHICTKRPGCFTLKWNVRDKERKTDQYRSRDKQGLSLGLVTFWMCVPFNKQDLNFGNILNRIVLTDCFHILSPNYFASYIDLVKGREAYDIILAIIYKHEHLTSNHERLIHPRSLDITSPTTDPSLIT